MHDVDTFALIAAIAAVAVVAAIGSNRLAERIRIPAPLIFLVLAAVASDIFPALGSLSVEAVQRVVTLALAVILFDGGMSIGRGRFRSSAGAIGWIGIAGTFVTTAALAVLAHYALGFGWVQALVLGAALAPTDPAVVFSVLGKREIAGRAGTILEGESGANDPVGIAVMVALLGAVGGGGHVGSTTGLVGGALLTFVLEMVIGAAVGLAGGWLLPRLMRIPLPSAGLYPIRVLAVAILLYGATTVAHGSGFLAVFVAGILIGDEEAPFKAEIAGFHSSLASLGEIVAFVVLGLTVHVGDLAQRRVWLIGLLLAVVLIVVIRPVIVGLLSLPIRLDRRERLFVLFAGLKGAVPILLGTFVLVTPGVDEPRRIYNVIFVVVLVSVAVQGSLTPWLADRLRLTTVTPPD